MPSALTRWLKSTKSSLFAPRAARPRSAPRTRSRLDMESLEAREVPATLLWGGEPGDNFGTMGNWRTPAGAATNAIPANGDTLIFSQTADTTINQNINGLDIATISFTNGGNVINLMTATDLDGSTGDQITSVANVSNTITGGQLNLIDNTAFISLAAGSVVNIGSQLVGNQGIQLTGPGALVLTGTGFNTFSGGTSIVSGTFFLSTNTPDNGLGASASTITIGDGVGGAGTAALILTGTSELQNNSPVSISSDGFLGLQAGASEDIGSLTINGGGLIASVTAGGTSVTVNGAVNIMGAATLNLALVDPNAAAGSTFTLINKTSAGAINGQFANAPNGGTVTLGGRTFTVNYAGGNGNDLVLTLTSPPTPPAPPAPFYSGAITIPNADGTSTLVVTGAGVAGGQTTLRLPAGSAAFFSDVSGDGVSDVILFLPNGVFVFNGQTGAFFLAFFDSNGDGVRELIRF